MSEIYTDTRGNRRTQRFVGEARRNTSGKGRKPRKRRRAEDFTILNESYVIFITEKDVLGAGLPMYHINRIIEELQIPFDDGKHIIYVNGAYKNDASDIGKLMHDFRCTSSIDMFYDVLKRGMHHFKETEGGRTIVCKAIETYGDQRELKRAIESALKMIADKMPLEKVAEYSGLSLEKVKELAEKKSA